MQEGAKSQGDASESLVAAWGKVDSPLEPLEGTQTYLYSSFKDFWLSEQ